MANSYETKFEVKERYEYLTGFGSYHTSEAFTGANSNVNNSPQKPPFGLRTERLSGTSFTAPRSKNLQTWMYRVTSSLIHDGFEPYEETPKIPSHMSPNSNLWPKLLINEGQDWTQQHLLARNGDPAQKKGTAIWIFAVTQDMPQDTAISSLDGDLLIVPQAGALDIQTELGKLLVRQNEFAVIPRGLRHRVTLASQSARGYICELYQGHWDLPELGPIGSTGLANVRDFQVPVAFFDGQVKDEIATANNSEWQIISRQNGRLWATAQDHTPFDVAAWHGTFYPFKYDLAKYNVLGNVLYDENDPSLFVVLSSTSGDNPGASAVDFLVLPPRWQVADALSLPYYHRNTHSEFFAPIINKQDPRFPLNRGIDFAPFGAGLHGAMSTHGAAEEDYRKAQAEEMKPRRLLDDGITLFLLETENPLYLSDWGESLALKNGGRKPRSKI